MRATDIVRQVLDLLDEIEGPHDIETSGIDSDIQIVQNNEPENRFKQILAMLNADSFGQYANTPNEIVAPIEAVTTLAGGGMNAPKHPADIRVKDPRGYE